LGGFIQGEFLFTMTPWKTPRKSIRDCRTRIIPLLSSMKCIYDTVLSTVYDVNTIDFPCEGPHIQSLSQNYAEIRQKFLGSG
jgi:hypothetical protein